MVSSRRVLEARAEAEEQFRVTIENAPIGMALVSLAGRFLRVNNALCSMTGYSEAELLSKTVQDVTHPDDFAADLESVRLMLAGEIPTYEIEKRYYTKDGAIVWTLISVSLVRDQTNEPKHFIRHIQDITARKEAEARLARDLASLAEAQAIAHLGSWECDLVTADWTWSREMYRIVGLPDPQRPGAPLDVLAAVVAEDRPAVRSAFQIERTQSTDIDLSFRIRRHSDGELRYTHARGRLVRDEQGAPARLVGTTQDITDTHLAELARREAEARFRITVDHAPIGTALVVLANGSRGRLLSTNQALSDLLGHSASALEGMMLGSLVHADDTVTLERALDLLATDRLARTEAQVRCLHADGHLVWASLAAAVVAGTDDATGLRNAVFHFIDIGERKRSQLELAESHQKVVEVSRLKSEFVANMSHEIRTPLNGLIGVGGLLLDTDLNEEQREYAEAVRASGDALMAVLEDVLDFSKIEAGKLEIDHQVFHLREMVEDAGTMLAVAADKQTVELMMLVEETLPAAVRGDGPRLRQVLVNLLSNAVKFTSGGEVLVHASQQLDDGERASLRFEVTDSGIGIDASRLEQIFDPFSQADSSTARRYGGTGLGLSICSQIVSLMGGEIGVESTIGEGSTFWFTIPLDVAVETDAIEREPVGVGGVKTLIVDDNETNLTIVERQLAAWGMDCTTVTGGDAALAKMHAAAEAGEPYQLVVLDSNMPQMTGTELAVAVKARKTLRSAALLMLTSSGDARAAAREAGIDGFVSKPVRQARLREEITRVLRAPNWKRFTLARPSPDDEREDRNLMGRRVLVAEDTPVNQLVAQRLLEKRGFVVDVAENGRDAVDMHEYGRYDAIFMDCQMPELDGYGATKQIRRREGSDSHTPIVAMTANTMKGDPERCLRAGMDDYLGKPLDPGLLDEILARTIWTRPAPRVIDAVMTATEDGDNHAPVSVLDPHLLDEMCDGDDELRARVVALFFDQARPAITELTAALARGDVNNVQQTAHALKGSARTLGAKQLAAMAARVCDSTTTNTLPTPDALQRVYALTAAALDPNESEVPA